MRRPGGYVKGAVLLILALAALSLGGCRTESAEVTVPHVEVAEKPAVSQTEEQKQAELGLETEAGTLLGEEEVVVMTKEGEPETTRYTRVRGNGDFSIAYDPAVFTMNASEEELRFEEKNADDTGALPIFISIQKKEEDSSEKLSDFYVEQSGEECSVEEVSVGEGEYAALWVSYAEGTDSESRTCDIYIIRHNESLYAVQLDCNVGSYESLGEAQQTILSTLRFDEG